MAETPALTPVEVMAKAAYERKDTKRAGDWESLKRLNPTIAQNWIEDMRAALRALAEMEPTEVMVADSYEAANKASFRRGEAHDTALVAGATAYILAAAQEGESK